MTANFTRTIEVFTEASQLPVGERAAYLDGACGDDAELRRKMEALLRSNERAGDFLSQPAATIGEARAKAVAGEKPGDRVDRYVLLQQIGEGGCGVVFVAEQQTPVLRRVALKVVKPGMDTKSVIARFAAERQALAFMDHPNIARVFDAGATETGRPYFVMELVDGVKITEYCDRHSLPINTRLELFVQVCDAIQHAHQKGIIHRDIKPSNILVATGTDGKPAPKVIDFGIAKATTGQQLTDKTVFTAFEMLIGTPAYMSPEQAALASADMDTRTDIYSLGVLLYELLTGTTPFDTGELLKLGFDELRRVIRDEEPARPSTRLSTMVDAERANVSKHHGAEAPGLIREMRGDLDWIVMKALEKDRARRYATAHGLAMDVQRYLSGEAILARPPSATYKFRKLAARNKLLVSGIAVTFVLLMVSLITTTRWLMTERRAQERMRQQMELARLDRLGLELYYQKKIPDSERAIFKALDMRRQFPQAEYTSETPRQTMLLMLLIYTGEFEKIKPFFDRYVDPSLLPRLECRALFETATLALAKHGRWDDAAALAAELYKSQPTNSSYCHIMAPLMVVRNDTESYRRLCGEIMTRFSNVTDPYVADQMAKDCLILPSSGVEPKAMAALADVAVSRGSNLPALPYFQFCKALAEFRMDHYDEAIKWAHLAARSPSRYPKATGSAIVAMSQFKLNQLDQAQAALAACNKIVDKLSEPNQEPGDEWRDWIIARALRSEAQRMIEGEPSADRPADPPR
jgi:serine/threonine protein kinase